MVVTYFSFPSSTIYKMPQSWWRKIQKKIEERVHYYYLPQRAATVALVAAQKMSYCTTTICMIRMGLINQTFLCALKSPCLYSDPVGLCSIQTLLPHMDWKNILTNITLISKSPELIGLVIAIWNVQSRQWSSNPCQVVLQIAYLTMYYLFSTQYLFTFYVCCYTLRWCKE